MLTVSKKLIIAEGTTRPIAVMIDYDSWLALEAILLSLNKEAKEQEEASTETLVQKRQMLANQIQWTQGDGLAYQARLREEWL